MNNRRDFIRIAGMAAASMAVGGCAAAKSLSGLTCSRDDRRPNIVFILIDDLGWKDTGVTGSKYYQTPAIDKMASEGMLFENAYSAAPVCTPSRGAIVSGKYPARTKLTDVHATSAAQDEKLYEYLSANPDKKPKPNTKWKYREARRRHVLGLSEYTMAEAFSDAGYVTAHIGKWHCGWGEKHSPGRQGYQVAKAYRTKPTFTKGHWGKYYTPKLAKGTEGIDPDAYMADVLTDYAVDFVGENKNKPFFLFLSHYGVHYPFQAKEELIEKYKEIPTTDQDKPIMAAMIESIDQSVGRVMDSLKENGIDDNTIVVFTSDNGGWNVTTSNYPLMGGKSNHFEAGMRVPLIVKWPGKIKPNTQSSYRTVAVDFYPTLLEMAQTEKSKAQKLDGVSLVPELIGKGRCPQRPIFFHWPHRQPTSSVIQDDWKLIRYYNDEPSGQYALFNLKEAGERVDLAEERTDKVKELSGILSAWLKETDAEMPIPNESYIPNAKQKSAREISWELEDRNWRNNKKKLESSRDSVK
jgi:arylsulfatase A